MQHHLVASITFPEFCWETEKAIFHFFINGVLKWEGFFFFTFLSETPPPMLGYWVWKIKSSYQGCWLNYKSCPEEQKVSSDYMAFKTGTVKEMQAWLGWAFLHLWLHLSLTILLQGREQMKQKSGELLSTSIVLLQWNWIVFLGFVG